MLPQPPWLLRCQMQDVVSQAVSGRARRDDRLHQLSPVGPQSGIRCKGPDHRRSFGGPYVSRDQHRLTPDSESWFEAG